MPEAEPFRFEGFAAPTTTQVPDEFFDELAPRLTEAELRVALYIIRRTFGFKKIADDISLKQMVQGIRTRDGKVIDHGAGVAKSAATRAVRGLVEKGVITAVRNRSAEKGDEPTTYALRFKDTGADPVFSKRTRGSPPKEHPRVLEEDPQQTVEQQTARQDSNPRKQPTPDHSPDSAPATSLNGTIAPAAPIPKPLRVRLPPEGRRRYDEDRRRIVDYLSDFARELGDAAPLASSVTRAVNLMHRADVDLEAFTEALYHARAVTKERWAAVRKEAQKPGDPFPRKEAMNAHVRLLNAMEDDPRNYAKELELLREIKSLEDGLNRVSPAITRRPELAAAVDRFSEAGQALAAQMSTIARRSMAEGAADPAPKTFARQDRAWLALIDAAQVLDDAIEVFIEGPEEARLARPEDRALPDDRA